MHNLQSAPCFHLPRDKKYSFSYHLCNETFGRNLQQIRLSCNFSQEQTVAKLQLLGSPLSRSTYSLIELGRGNIFVSDLVGLKQIFKTNYSDFFKDISVSR